ncbi:S41 family peptidase [Stenotrophomonas indicatrix]|uniref:S41 family peptidase n=1 Tax=Stenotrophomonas indicatrix TaxID=2045451 RepID=UPI000FD82967|nr:S41 family peptidase [Stenotrophomonas indicatrix]
MRAARTATLLLALLPALSWAQQTAPVPLQETPGKAASSEEAVTSKVPLDDIRRFVAVYNAVRAAYVDPVDDNKLMQSAVRGLLLDLDPHSTYFNKEDAEAFDEQANGAYEGIGVELQQQPDNASMKVISPIDDTPAAKAGILAGDLIIAIDGKPISAIDASEPLRGPAGSKVVLTIVRDGKPKPFDVSLTRQTIRVTSVRSRLLEPGYGYIRLSTFQADTGSDFQKHLQQLQKQSGGNLKGLVLDLRSNPGGLLTAAVQVADDLLDKGNIVSTRGRISISDARFDATPGDLLKGAPVVVLVDAGSASASEVLAGALRDNKRARVIGSRTFGKGSVQTVLPLDNGDSVKLTTARYYTPSGKSIQATGIVPEVELKAAPRPEDEALPASLSDYSEATLPGHLRGDEEGTEGYRAGAVLPGDGPINDALAELKNPGLVAARLKAEAAKADVDRAAKAAAKPAPKAEPKAEAKPEAKPAEIPAKP